MPLPTLNRFIIPEDSYAPFALDEFDRHVAQSQAAPLPVDDAPVEPPAPDPVQQDLAAFDAHVAETEDVTKPDLLTPTGLPPETAKQPEWKTKLEDTFNQLAPLNPFRASPKDLGEAVSRVQQADLAGQLVHAPVGGNVFNPAANPGMGGAFGVGKDVAEAESGIGTARTMLSEALRGKGEDAAKNAVQEAEEVAAKIAAMKSPNSASAMKAVAQLKKSGHEVGEVDAAIEDYRAIIRKDYDEVDDYRQDREEAWQAIVDAFDSVEAPEIAALPTAVEEAAARLRPEMTEAEKAQMAAREKQDELSLRGGEVRGLPPAPPPSPVGGGSSGVGGEPPPANPRQLPKDLPPAGILAKFDVRDSYPMLREIERRAVEKLGAGAARPHALATQMPGGKLESDILLEKEMRPIERRVIGSGVKLEDLNIFIRNTEAIQEEALGLKNPGGLTAQEAAARLASMRTQIGSEKYAALEQGERELQAYMKRNFLDPARGTLLSDEQIAAYTDRRTHYFPHIVLDYIAQKGDETPIGRTPISVAISELSRARLGSEREVADPLDAIIARTYRINASLVKNRAATAIIDALNQIDPAYLVPKREGASVESAYKTISRIVDGKREAYVVDGRLGIDDEALKSTSGNENPLLSFLIAANNLSKQAYTSASINFIERNPIRDQLEAFFREGLSPFGYHTAAALWSVITKDANYVEWARRHGGISGFFGEASLSQAPQTAKELARSPAERGARLLANPLALLREVGRIGEEMTRVAVYTQKSGLVRGPALPGLLRGLHGGPEVDPLTATSKSRESTVDFSNGHALIMSANRVAMFLNANIKGGFNAVEPLFRGGSNLSNRDRISATVRLGEMLSAAGGVWAYNQAFGDIYSQIPEYERSTQIIFINPVQPTVSDENGKETPNYFAVPKPATMRVFWNAIENTYRWAANQNPKTAKELAEEALGVTTPYSSVTDIASFAPPALAIFGDIQADFDPFRGYAIEGSLKNKPRELRFRDGTSETAKALARTPVADMIGLSPVQIDYIVNTAFGGAGRQALWAADQAGGAVGALAQKPTADPYIEASRTPGPGAFLHTRGGAEEERSYRAVGDALSGLEHAIVAQLESQPDYQNATPDRQRQMQTQAQSWVKDDLMEQYGLEAKPKDLGLPRKYLQISDPAKQAEVDKIISAGHSAKPGSAEALLGKRMAAAYRVNPAYTSALKAQGVVSQSTKGAIRELVPSR